MIAALALLVALAGPALAQEGDAFTRGMLAANAHEFAEALRLWRPLAEAGDARAAYFVGMTVEQGEGVPADAAEAARYYAMAARAGHAEAGNALAVLLVEGRGLPKDPVEAWAWFALAAERGSGFAAANRDRLGERLSGEQRALAEVRLAALRAADPQ